MGLGGLGLRRVLQASGSACRTSGCQVTPGAACGKLVVWDRLGFRVRVLGPSGSGFIALPIKKGEKGSLILDIFPIFRVSRLPWVGYKRQGPNGQMDV